MGQSLSHCILCPLIYSTGIYVSQVQTWFYYSLLTFHWTTGINIECTEIGYYQTDMQWPKCHSCLYIILRRSLLVWPKNVNLLNLQQQQFLPTHNVGWRNKSEEMSRPCIGVYFSHLTICMHVIFIGDPTDCTSSD